MYNNFYRLRVNPFHLAPDPRFCFNHRNHKKSHACMLHALEQGDGILVVTGQAGTGKTMLVRNFLTQLEPENVLTATLVTTQLQPDDLLRMVSYSFGLNAAGLDKATILHRLEQSLARERNAGRRTLLIIDEAQNLTTHALEELRLLTNMESCSRPLLQIFLVGQERLLELIHTPHMEQLNQRIGASCYMKPLNLMETHLYLEHRLRCAGWRGDPHLTNAAIVLIQRTSQGLPRYINKICDRLLLHGSIEKRHELDADDLAIILREMHNELLIPPDGGNRVANGILTAGILGSMNTFSSDKDWLMNLTDEEQSYLEQSEPITPLGTADKTSTEDDNLSLITRLVDVDTDSGIPSAAVTVSDVDLQAPNHRIETNVFDPEIRASADEHNISSARHKAEKSSNTTARYGFAAAAILVALYILLIYKGITHLNPDNNAASTANARLSDTRTNTSLPAATSINSTTVAAGVPFAARTQQEDRAAIPAASQDGNETRSPAMATHDAEVPHSEKALPQPDPQAGLSRSLPASNTTTANDSGLDIPAGVTNDHRIQKLLLRAEDAFNNDRFTIPKNNCAYYYYQRVLEIEPQNRIAELGIRQIVERYRVLASSFIKKEDYETAKLHIQRGLKIDAQNKKLLALKNQLVTPTNQVRQEQPKSKSLTAKNTEGSNGLNKASGIIDKLKSYIIQYKPGVSHEDEFDPLYDD